MSLCICLLNFVVIGQSAADIHFFQDRIYSFGDIAIFIFLRFGFKFPIQGDFWGVWGIFPQMTSPIVLTPKRHFLTRKRVV